MHKDTPIRLREKRYFKEIGWLLLVKLCLLIAIRIVFFSHPEHKPDGVETTSAHLLGSATAAPSVAATSPAVSSSFPSENRSSHDQ